MATELDKLDRESLLKILQPSKRASGPMLFYSCAGMTGFAGGTLWTIWRNTGDNWHLAVASCLLAVAGVYMFANGAWKFAQSNNEQVQALAELIERERQG